MYVYGYMDIYIYIYIYLHSCTVHHRASANGPSSANSIILPYSCLHKKCSLWLMRDFLRGSWLNLISTFYFKQAIKDT